MTPTIGWSLLCLLTSADAPTAQAVRDLSARPFRQREAAHKHLASQMPRVRLPLTVVTWGPDAEAARRARQIIGEWKPSLRYQLKWWWSVWPGEMPHFDMVDPDRYPLQGAAREPPDYLGQFGRKALFNAYFCNHPLLDFKPDFDNYRSATAWYCRDLMLAGHDAEPVRVWLLSLLPLQKEWYEKYTMQPESP